MVPQAGQKVHALTYGRKKLYIHSAKTLKKQLLPSIALLQAKSYCAPRFHFVVHGSSLLGLPRFGIIFACLGDHGPGPGALDVEPLAAADEGMIPPHDLRFRVSGFRAEQCQHSIFPRDRRQVTVLLT